MHTVRYLGIAVLVTALSAIGVTSPAMVGISHAQISSTAHSTVSTKFDEVSGYYDIVSLGYYCADGTTACYDNCLDKTLPCPGLSFAGVEAVGATDGSNAGTPFELITQCGQTTPSGDVIMSFLDTRGSGTYKNGTIGAKGTLLSTDALESDTMATSSITGSSFSSDFGFSSSVTGVQATDNSQHLLLSGGMKITIRGILDNITQNHHHYFGTIACQTGAATRALQDDLGCTTTYDAPDQPFMAEGALEPSQGDEFHNYNDLGPFDPSQGFDNYLMDPAVLQLCNAV